METIEEKTISEEFNELIVNITMKQQKKKKKKLKNRIKRLFKKIKGIFTLTPLQKYKKRLKIQERKIRDRKRRKVVKKGIINFLMSFFKIFRKKKINKDIKDNFQNKLEKEIEEEVESRIKEEIEGKYKPYHPKEKVTEYGISC